MNKSVINLSSSKTHELFENIKQKSKYTFNHLKVL